MISVVVPIYNMEKYLARCLESLISQTLEDIEILLIDDGSTDSSAEICKAYVEKDNRIKYIYKKNGGLSDARNVGIVLAKGEYITFVDSDDYVHSSFLEYLLNLIHQHNAEIASCVHFETSMDTFEFDLKESRVECMDGEEACKRLVGNLAPILTAACGKLYKTEIVQDVRFPFKRLHEDVATTYKYYINSEKVALGYRELYAYYQHSNSIMHRVSDKKIDDELWAMSERALYFQNTNRMELASLSWDFVVKVLIRDYRNKEGTPEILKKYAKLCIKNASRRNAKVKVWAWLECKFLAKLVF